MRSPRHIVEDGELELVVPVGEHVERLRRGDVVLLPRGDRHHRLQSRQMSAQGRASRLGERDQPPRT
ncbi:MAG: cupin domain-containing protein [Solirubrobacteraceae bacterium]